MTVPGRHPVSSHSSSNSNSDCRDAAGERAFASHQRGLCSILGQRI